MRHNKKINHLGRTYSHRDAMLSNMASSLIKHKRIFTTVPKAKELRKYVEPLINKCKEDTTHSRRVVFKALQNKTVVTELFNDVSQKIGDRPGGYTRIIKTGYRLGDNAAMCFIELVDYNENMLKTAKADKATKTRRSRRKGDAPENSVTEEKIKTPKAKAPKDSKMKAEVPSPVVEEIPAAVEVPAEEAPVVDVPAEEAPEKEEPVTESSIKETPSEETSEKGEPVEE